MAAPPRSAADAHPAPGSLAAASSAVPRVLLVAGGTGGHISPGLALAEELARAGLAPAMRTLARNRQYPDFAQADFPLYFYEAPPVRKSPLDLALFPARFCLAFLRAFLLIGRLDARAIVGLGGYPMAPAILAGIVRGRAVYLCEQNAVPGKVTRFLARRARRVFLAVPLVPSAAGFVPAEKLVLTGNPLREKIVSSMRAPTSKSADAFANLARAARKKNALRVLVVGGSQGATQLNAMVKAPLPLLPDALWMLQCGVRNLEQLSGEIDRTAFPNIELVGFTRDIHALYRSADVLVTRAGAGVLTEAAGFGLPLVLIPYPYAADDHQTANAEVFARAGAARLIARRDEDPGELIQALEELSDPTLRKRMGAAAQGLARLDAAALIVERIKADLLETT